MAVCMYLNDFPFEPIEGRKVVNPSYKAKGNSGGSQILAMVRSLDCLKMFSFYFFKDLS